jgi:N-succinyldiaminopimelate aminotransferase
MDGRVPYLSARLRPFASTIFAEMSALAVTTGSINLGQGFPDTDGPAEIIEAAVAALRAGHNQYAPGPGVPELRAAVAQHQREFYGLEYDAEAEVLVTAGATEAIAAALLALCEPGDEVVTFDPSYDAYPADIAMAGARHRPVTLRPPSWTFDFDELKAAIGPRTRLVLVNSPHNPTGKVFSYEELECIAGHCRERDLLAVTDEVYEHLVFDGTHRPLATLPGMRDRTLGISSAGKTFSLTGWKIGWACGPAELVAAVRATKQFLTYTNGTPFQFAVAGALAAGRRYVDEVAGPLRERRDQLDAGLRAVGFDVLASAATYFLTTDGTNLGEPDGVAFCRSLPARCGVVAIPSSVFYARPEEGRALVRWAFCKRPEVLEAAVDRLGRLAR